MTNSIGHSFVVHGKFQKFQGTPTNRCRTPTPENLLNLAFCSQFPYKNKEKGPKTPNIVLPYENAQKIDLVNLGVVDVIATWVGLGFPENLHVAQVFYLAQ